MPRPKQAIEVFIASPGDLAEERLGFREQIGDLNLGFGDGAGVEFVSLIWEDLLATTGRRPQSVINQYVDRCDVFILTLHRHWGQKAPDSEFSSYTEEEFYRALSRWNREKKPEIFVFFKSVDAVSIADPGPQLNNVLSFKRELEDSRTVLYKTYEDVRGFRQLVDDHLRGFVRGDLPPTDLEATSLPLPIDVVERIRQAEERARVEAARAKTAEERANAGSKRLEALMLMHAEHAAEFARDGRLERARESMAAAISGTTNVDVLRLAGEFYFRLGELDEAERVVRRQLGLIRDDDSAMVDALGRLGRVLQSRGDMIAAEEMHRKALEISVRIDRPEFVAACEDNLGLICQTRGDLNAAEELHRRSLETHESLGNSKGVSLACNNLGSIYCDRGELEAAEEMYRRCLEISEGLENLEGVAGSYNNLGIVNGARGDLDGAEKMYRKSLEIFESLGSSADIASCYSNIGVIIDKKGQKDEAEEMYRKALEIYEQQGRLEGIARSYTNLGVLHSGQGDLEAAEEECRKSLEINKRIGRLGGVAISYGNLGVIFDRRGELDSAEETHRLSLEIRERIGDRAGMASSLVNLGFLKLQRGEETEAERLYRKSLAINEAIGNQWGVARCQVNLGTMYQQLGDTNAAEQSFQTALSIYESIGAASEAAGIKDCLDGLRSMGS